MLWDFILALWWRPAKERRPTCKFFTFLFLNFPYSVKTYSLPAPQGCQNTQTLPHITLHYITLHYITLHYITLHYITLPWYIATCTVYSMVRRSIAYMSEPRHHITNMPPRLDIEAMDRPTILYLIYRMVSAQQMDLFARDSQIFSMQFFIRRLICLITKLVAIHNFLWLCNHHTIYIL